MTTNELSTSEISDVSGSLISDLDVEVLLAVLARVSEGDFTARMPLGWTGTAGRAADAINDMVDRLSKQDWLKTHRERFTRMLQGQRDLETVSNMILSELAPLVSAQHAVFYVVTSPRDGTEPVLQMEAGYGYEERKHLSTSFRFGEGLVGQCAKEKKRILLTDVPSDYVKINSGLGEASPLNIIVLPVLFEGSVRAVIELASFTAFSVTHQAFLDQLPDGIGLVLNTIEADMMTADLLEQSQSQGQELRSRQEELRESNEDLARQAQLLAVQNQEVERSKKLVEEKAGQLTLSSKYKSEFIANMSHELRTPLNSLLILAEQLESNAGDTMTPAQVEYASVIRGSGNDLLELLNSILSLAKAESGTVMVEKTEVSTRELSGALDRDFGLVAEAKGLGFAVSVAPDCPPTFITDQQRLRQVLNNLLSNAFKFTEQGHVKVECFLARSGWSNDNRSLADASSVVAFAVTDTGIGIDPETQERIFQPFAQGDGSTARLYGGTGLGLSISHELAALLGGEVNVVSAVGKGSTFTVYLPQTVVGAEAILDPVPATIVEAPEASAPPLDQAEDWTGEAPMMGKDRRRSYALEESAFGGARVLVVDDDFRNVFAMKALLERGAAIVSFAESGADAIEMLSRDPKVDIVLMDIMMPVMDGYATMRAIRKMDHCRDLPIIAVTGKVMIGERQRCLDAGANDYVPKPVDTGELVAAISPWLPTLVAAVKPWRPLAGLTP